MAGETATAKYFMRFEAGRMDAMVARQRTRQNRKAMRVSMDERLASVESQIGEVLLPAMALNRLLVRKQLVTREELVQIADEFSAHDKSEAGHANSSE